MDESELSIKPELLPMLAAYVENKLKKVSSFIAEWPVPLPEVREWAHQTKGTGSSLGLDQVTLFSKSLEDAAKDGDEEGSRKGLDSLHNHLNQVWQMLKDCS